MTCKTALIYFAFLSVAGGCVVVQASTLPAKTVSHEQQKMTLAEVIELPEACLAGHYPCAVQVLSAGAVVWGQEHLQAGRETQLVFLSREQVQVVQGAAWFRGLSGQTVKFGETQFRIHGDALFEREKDRVLVRSLSGQVEAIAPSGAKMLLPAGFENWYRGLDRFARVEQGLLRAFELKSFVTSWLRIVGPAKDEWHARLQQYKENQKTAVGQSSDIYKQVLELRQLASERSEREAQERLRREQQENQRFREMFRKRFYEGIDPES